MNEMNHYEESTGVLDKKGAVILVASLVIALALIVTGVVLLATDNASRSLSAGQKISVYSTSGEKYSYSHVATSSDYYYLYLDGASLFSINQDYTTVSATGTTFDNVYKIYLSKGDSLTFTVTARSSSHSLKISKIYN